MYSTKVCVSTVEEVTDMYGHLLRSMDGMMEETGHALILKVSAPNAFFKKLANRTINFLVNAGKLSSAPRPVMQQALALHDSSQVATSSPNPSSFLSAECVGMLQQM